MPTPSESFINELKRIDKNLSVVWNNRRHRWIILHKDAKGKIYIVILVQYKDGSYKPLDRRTLDALWFSRKFSRQRPQDIMYQIDKENEEAELAKEKQLTNDNEAIAKEIHPIARERILVGV